MEKAPLSQKKKGYFKNNSYPTEQMAIIKDKQRGNITQHSTVQSGGSRRSVPLGDEQRGWAGGEGDDSPMSADEGR